MESTSNVDPGPVRPVILYPSATSGSGFHPEALEPGLRRAIEATQVSHFKVGPMTQCLGWEQMPYPLTAQELLAGNSRSMSMEPNAAAAVISVEEILEVVHLQQDGVNNGFGAYVAFVPKEDAAL